MLNLLLLVLDLDFWGWWSNFWVACDKMTWCLANDTTRFGTKVICVVVSPIAWRWGPYNLLAYFVMILSDVSVNGGCRFDTSRFSFWPSLVIFFETLMVKIILFGVGMVGPVIFKGEIPVESLLFPLLKIRMQWASELSPTVEIGLNCNRIHLWSKGTDTIWVLKRLQNIPLWFWLRGDFYSLEYVHQYQSSDQTDLLLT